MKEEKATASKLLDSTTILAYLVEGKHKEIIDAEETLYISALSLFEVKRKLLGKKVPKKEIKEKMNFIKKRMISLTLTDLIAERAASLSFKHTIPAIDALIYATTITKKATLFTRDNDFRGLASVKILE